MGFYSSSMPEKLSSARFMFNFSQESRWRLLRRGSNKYFMRLSLLTNHFSIFLITALLLLSFSTVCLFTYFNQISLLFIYWLGYYLSSRFSFISNLCLFIIYYYYYKFFVLLINLLKLLYFNYYYDLLILLIIFLLNFNIFFHLHLYSIW